ncbi:hypothetical protein FBULB1_3731 [Fusarium bulbicola]|nr:hypothetical protein FBULB1_3731 [Fusarium bulbicola]
MGVAVTDEVAKKVARFSELLKWVREPVNQPKNTIENEEEPKSSMYPELHSLIAESLAEDGLEYTFRQNDQKIDIKRVFDSRVIGEFTCDRRRCNKRTWSSNSVAIRIREYEGHQYNVKVYHQECKRCNQPSRPEIEKLSYVNRVSFRIKKWNGIEAKPMHLEVASKGGHMERLCVGCQQGHCGKKK